MRDASGVSFGRTRLPIDATLAESHTVGHFRNGERHHRRRGSPPPRWEKARTKLVHDVFPLTCARSFKLAAHGVECLVGLWEGLR